MQKNKVFLFFGALLLLTVASIQAQSTEIVENLLLSDQAAFGDSVYMIAVGSGLLDDDVSVSEAVSNITKNGWNKSGKNAEDTITLGEFSYIAMQALDIPGGIMYRLFPSPRYALRELAYLGIIDEKFHPDNTLSGSNFINILSAILEIKESE